MNLKTVVLCLLVTLGVVVLLLGKHNQSAKEEVTDTESITNDNGFDLQTWPARAMSPRRDPVIEARIDALLAQMSIAEKVGQIIQPELKYVTPEDVKTYHLGSILNGGGTTPNNDKYASLDDWVNTADAFYTASMDESDGNIAIPLIWGTDAVHGNNNVYGATIFPHNIGLGAANDLPLMYRIGQVTAREVAATGVNWTFGPTVAVARDVRWGRTYESYSENPELVNQYAREMVRGIQGEFKNSMRVGPNHIVSTAKHFLGDGGTSMGVDRGDTVASEWELRQVHGAGYIAALDANVLTTMASFNSWNGDKLHGHRYLLTDVLKERMGFEGFVVGDWNGHQQVPGCHVSRCPAAINAGLDMFMVPEHWKALYENTLKDVEQGHISPARLDDAVRRILRVKLIAGLFDAGPVADRPLVGDVGLIGHPDHRALAREAVRKSLVLLKNNGGVLPLKPGSRVLIAGDAADNIAKQSGGWSLTWQGTGNQNSDFPGATSILVGLQSAIEQAGGQSLYAADGVWEPSDFGESGRPDVAVVVFGEEPYAEWHGDLINIEYQYGDKRDLRLLQALQAQGIPVVSVFITGRPLWVNKEVNASDAFVVAWLPGTEGAGVADVLVADAAGNAPFDFQGRLSFSWPKYVNQARLNFDETGYDPLFPLDYGLSYASTNPPLGPLDERNARQPNSVLDELWGFVSRANAPWSIVVRERDEALIAMQGNSVSTPTEMLVVQSVDKVAQEDARRLNWSGVGSATFALNAQVPQDLSAYQRHSAVMTLSAQLNATTQADVAFSVLCDAQSCADLPEVAAAVTNLSPGAWQNIVIDSTCLARSEQRFAGVRQLLAIRTDGELDLTLADIKLVPQARLMEDPSALTVRCGG
ncbi:1,4-beta-D-glucan glucohydrolase [Arenicella chitinivorans]|uniref:1,4-beta-D-glucan glucohydrolase n=1 Tax=Arenicella chitinivorans TaxID=1329800 RepID=A0A918RK29_9GAMM|nr:glycoside hydrolase family 3 protein [Arenicella chitinivorans]GGZ97971.1 1,4-beta-D-glucan glucohydrolase [Arenicella chitinivorans]